MNMDNYTLGNLLSAYAGTIMHETLRMWSRQRSYNESEVVPNKVRWRQQKTSSNRLLILQTPLNSRYNQQFKGHKFKVGRSKK